MPNFVIVGKTDCVNYFHAIHVAEYLKRHLPCFRFSKSEKPEEEWKHWLSETNAHNEWFVTVSPLIWKEISRSGGKPYLIGSLSEFWEYCYDYYGLESKISKNDLLKLIADYRQESKTDKKTTVQNISIVGADNDIIEILLLEINNVMDMEANNQIVIKLYEDLEDFEKAEYLLDLAEELHASLTNVQSVSLVCSLEDALYDCDLLVVVTDFSRESNEDMFDWLERCSMAMRILGEEINYAAKRSLRVVLAHQGPVCFTATTLLQCCTKIRVSNIVAVTADEGLQAIDVVSGLTDIPIENICGPVVWGFTGISSFVDVLNGIFRADVYRPFKRAVTSPETAILSKGTVVCELRCMSSAIENEEELHKELEARKNRMTRGSRYAKTRAVGSLIKMWFAEKPSDEIISLGVCANGSFGLPVGAVYSQPVMMNESRFWKPFNLYPVQKNVEDKISEMLFQLAPIFKNFNITEKETVNTS